MLNFHRECWNPVKKHSKALVFFAVSKQIPSVYSADSGQAEISGVSKSMYVSNISKSPDYTHLSCKLNE